MNCRNQFTFYKSFDDVIEDLTEKQIAEYIKVMLDVQFLRVKIDDVVFSDKTLRIVWKSQKHSIEKSVKGYLDSQNSSKVKNPYLGVYSPLRIPSEGLPQQEQVQVQVQGEVKGQVQEKEQEKKKFTFSLRKDTHFSNLSNEYQDMLNEYIVSLPNPHLSFEDFRDSCLAKNIYKYKNFKITYNKWNKKDSKPTKQLMSFKQQDATKTEDAIDAFLTARDNGFDLRNVREIVQEVEVIER